MILAGALDTATERPTPAAADGREGAKSDPQRRHQQADRDHRLQTAATETSERSNASTAKAPRCSCHHSASPTPLPAQTAKPHSETTKQMHALLQKPAALQAHHQRKQIVQPMLANTNTIKRTDHFMRRGLTACESEWQLIATTHNPPKALAPPQAEQLKPTEPAPHGPRLTTQTQ